MEECGATSSVFQRLIVGRACIMAPRKCQWTLDLDMQQQLCMMDLLILVFKIIDLICKMENKFNAILILEFFLTLSILGSFSQS